jgi:hypothetical protein
MKICPDHWLRAYFWPAMLSLGLISAGTGVRLQAQTAPPASAPTQVPPQVAGGGSANGRRGDSATDEQRSDLIRVREKLAKRYQDNRKLSAALAIATSQTAVLATAPIWPGIFQLGREEAEVELAGESELEEFMKEENSSLEDLVKLEEEQRDKPPTAEQEKAAGVKKTELRNRIRVLQQFRAKYEADITARRKELEKTAELEQPWSPSLVTNLAWLILGFTLIVVCLATFLLRKNDVNGQMTLKVFGLTLIISMSALLLIVGYGKDQLTPIIGLFGAIAGYLLGKETSGPAATRPAPKEPDHKAA